MNSLISARNKKRELFDLYLAVLVNQKLKPQIENQIK